MHQHSSYCRVILLLPVFEFSYNIINITIANLVLKTMTGRILQDVRNASVIAYGLNCIDDVKFRVCVRFLSFKTTFPVLEIWRI